MPGKRATTRYRDGARDARARAAHVKQSREYGRALADAEFPPAERAKFLAELGRIGNMAKACKSFGINHALVYGRMRWDSWFADDVESVLAEVCQGGDMCGRPAGAKRGGCCAACRAAKRGRSGSSTSRRRSV